MSDLRGELAALGAAACWAASAILYTRSRTHARPLVMTLYKSLLALSVYGGVLALQSALGGSGVGPLQTGGFAEALRPRVLGWLAISAVLGITLGDTFFFAAVHRIGARRTTLLVLLTPIFAAIGGAWLRQALPSPQIWAGIGVTLAGIALVVVRPAGRVERDDRPGTSRAAVRLGVLLAIGSALVNGAGIVMTKAVIAAPGVLPVALVRLCAAASALLVFDLLRTGPRPLARDLARAAGSRGILWAAIFGTVFGFALFQYSIASTSPPVTAALTSTEPLLVAPLAARFLGEKLSFRAIVGTAIGVLGVVWIVLG